MWAGKVRVWANRHVQVMQQFRFVNGERLQHLPITRVDVAHWAETAEAEKNDTQATLVVWWQDSTRLRKSQN